jgi:hypothetical protein
LNLSGQSCTFNCSVGCMVSFYYFGVSSLMLLWCTTATFLGSNYCLKQSTDHFMFNFVGGGVKKTSLQIAQ